MRACATNKFDRVWIALHGPGGEDGTLQGALEFLGVPYTGSGVMGSAIGMDKLASKRLALAIGVATADFLVLRGPADFDAAAGAARPAAHREACDAGLKRRHVKGRRTRRNSPPPTPLRRRLMRWCSPSRGSRARSIRSRSCKDQALPSIRIETPRTFYDYQAKYFRDDTRYHCPSGLSVMAEEHLANLSLAAFGAVGASGWGRADFMMDETGRPLLLEVNTIPGMTDHSLVPMAARARGIDFDELVWQVLETSFARVRI